VSKDFEGQGIGKWIVTQLEWYAFYILDMTTSTTNMTRVIEDQESCHPYWDMTFLTLSTKKSQQKRKQACGTRGKRRNLLVFRQD
jgi:hypothetical protein